MTKTKSKTANQTPTAPKKKSSTKSTKRKLLSPLMVLLIIFVVVAFVLGSKFKGLVVVSSVNGKPIYSWELVSRLWQRFGQQTLEDLVAERLVLQEAAKEKISIPLEEIQKEVEKIKTEYGGQSALEDVLKTQGLDYNAFEEGVKLQLTVEKLLEGETTVTEREVEAFILKYEGQMQASQEADLIKEAQEILKSQKMSEAFANFFPTLKEKAKILHFLKF
jgi:hypothetical protein